MSKFKFNGICYCYTTLVPESFIDEFNKNAKDGNSFTMYGDRIMSYKGKIYCKESECEIRITEVVND